MVVWRFWQPSCCQSIPCAAMARNSCCVMWPSLPLHASFLIFCPGLLNLRPAGHDWRAAVLSQQDFTSPVEQSTSFMCGLLLLHWQSTLLPTFLTVNCIVWTVLILPTYFSQSNGWWLGILRWIRWCPVLRCYAILPTLTESLISWSTHCLLHFLKICHFSKLGKVLQSKDLGRVHQMCLFQEGETRLALSSRSVIIDLETAKFATL